MKKLKSVAYHALFAIGLAATTYFLAPDNSKADDCYDQQEVRQ